MKTTVILALLLFFNIINIYSQETNLFIGFNAGPSYTYIRTNEQNLYKKDPKVGYYFGLEIETNRTSWIDFSGGIGFERKGYHWQGDDWHLEGEIPDVIHRIGNYDYLIVPMNIILRTGHKRIFYLKTGLFVGYLLKVKLAYGTKPIGGFSDFTSLSDNRFDYGFSTSVGSMIPVSKKNYLSIELRGNLGISNIEKYTDSAGKTFFNRTFSINLLLGIKHRL